MSVFDLIKATLICGLVSFLVYSYPVVSQVTMIGLLGALWLSCAHQTVEAVRRRKA